MVQPGGIPGGPHLVVTTITSQELLGEAVSGHSSKGSRTLVVMSIVPGDEILWVLISRITSPAKPNQEVNSCVVIHQATGVFMLPEILTLSCSRA